MASISANETTTPILPCVSVDDMKVFYESLGFRTIYEQRRPYIYLAVAWSGFELHFRKAPKGMDPANEDGGAAIVHVDAVVPYHSAFVAAMRAAHGRLLTKGLPRITRLRPGASRFTLYDPSGNSVIVVQRDEPPELEYGGRRRWPDLPRRETTREFTASSRTTTEPRSGTSSRPCENIATTRRQWTGRSPWPP